MVINFYGNGSCWHEIIYNPLYLSDQEMEMQEVGVTFHDKGGGMIKTQAQVFRNKISALYNIMVVSWTPFLELTKTFMASVHNLPSDT